MSRRKDQKICNKPCIQLKLIRDMATIIDPEEDYLTILAAEEQIAADELKSRKELEDAHANLKALMKILEAARTSSTRPPSVPSAESHAATIQELDATRLSLGKAISDAEALLGSKEAELAALREETRTLEERDPAAEHERELDGTVLRLQIYKGMGFEPIFDKDGGLIKMLVRAKSGDIHVVEFTNEKSDLEYADLLWKLASS